MMKMLCLQSFLFFLQYTHMSAITKMYKDNFIQRFDKDEAIPYYSASDFPGLKCEEKTFNNSLGIEIHYFFYYYANYKSDTVVLFCPGIGPGHTAYLAEIDYFCKVGYRVLTIDYTGCGASKGETLLSVNEPTRDVVELLNNLHLNEEIVIIGHSLGAYTSLNVINLLPEINRGVIMSGFVSLKAELLGFMKIGLLTIGPRNFEKKANKEYASINNWKYLKTTSDKLLFIHSTDDQMVNFKHNTNKVMKIKNPNLSFKIVEGKKHNPNYSMDAIKNMNTWMGQYFSLIRQGELKTLEERHNFFLDKPISKMTEQDPEIMDLVLDFIN